MKLPQNLQVLRLSNNKITYVGNLAESAPRLKILDLSRNRLISLDGIRESAKLRELNVSYNYIADD